MDYDEITNSYDKYLKDIAKYRKDYLDDIIEKYVNTDDPGCIIDIRTLKVVKCGGVETKFPPFGTLNSYSCEPAKQLLEEIRNLKNKDHNTSEKKFLECAQRSSTELSNVKNKDPDTSEKKISECAQQSSREVSNIENKDPGTSGVKYPQCDLRLARYENEVSNKDLATSQKKVSECDKRISTVIVARKNPAFKRNLNFLSLYKNLPVDDLSFSRSFSEISNSNKNVSSSSNSNSDADNEELDSVNKQRKHKYTVKSKYNNEISHRNFTAKSIIYFRKWQTFQNDGEEIVICNSKTSYASNKVNCRNSILNSYTNNNKKLDSVNKQRNVEYRTKFHRETLCIIRSAKLRHPYYRKLSTCQNS